jgi:hypothetical protein
LAHLFPVKRRQNLQQKFLSPKVKRSLVDLIPDARPGLIYITIFRGGPPARAVPQTFWAFHRTNESGLLQQAVSTHAAAEQRTLNAIFQDLKGAIAETFFIKGSICGLPSPAGRKTRHKHLNAENYILYIISIVLILPDFEWVK